MKKIIVFLMATAMLISLVACGGVNKKVQNNGFSWEHLDWSKGADDSDGKVTLRVTSWRQYDKAYYEEIEKRFEEKYDWIDVKLEFTASQSAYYSNIQADIMSGDAPDVMDLHRTYMREYAKEGILAPQTDFAYMDTYKDVAKATTVVDGENFAFMVAYNYFGLIYNVDVFNEVGVTVPTTPEELVSVVAKLKEAGYGGISYAGATEGSKFARNILDICVGNNSGIKEGIDNGSITDISSVKGVKDAFKTIDYYVKNDIFYNAYEGITYEAATSLFAQEKAAILYGGTYSLGEAEQTYPNINFGYFAIPAYTENSLNASEPAQNACISANCENLGAAKLWVEFIATAEISSYFCSNSKMLSTIEGVTLDNDVSKMIIGSSEGFVLETPDCKNAEYWELAYQAVFDNVMLKGAEWEKEVKSFARKLEEYDLSNL